MSLFASVMMGAAAMVILVASGLCSDGMIGCGLYAAIAVPCLVVGWAAYRIWATLEDWG